MSFTLVTVKFLPAEAEDCVWPLAAADEEAELSEPACVPASCTWCPTWDFRSLVAPFS